MVVQSGIEAFTVGSRRKADEVLPFDCVIALTLKIHSPCSLWSSVYFFTLTSGYTLFLTARVMCLFMGLYNCIHLHLC